MDLSKTKMVKTGYAIQLRFMSFMLIWLHLFMKMGIEVSIFIFFNCNCKKPFFNPGLKNCSEENLEGLHKLIRKIRVCLARKTSAEDNLVDTLNK